MLQLKENERLGAHTTFRIGGPARYFAEVKSEQELREALGFAKQNNLPLFILGGGSNVLASDQGFAGMVINISNSGIYKTLEDEVTVGLRVAAGENWDDLVAFAVKNGWWGIENMSGIPGRLGGVVVQNAGAYGQEAAGVIESVLAFNLKTGEIAELNSSACRFGYRSSIFNQGTDGNYVVWEVKLRLHKVGAPDLRYKDLKNRFGESVPSLEEIRAGVLSIRREKFPDPSEMGSAGSFFKNCLLAKPEFDRLAARLAEKHPEGQDRLMEYGRREENGRVKVPTAFLLDILGLKRERCGQAMINVVQPQIILNLGGATAADVLGLFTAARAKVYQATGIVLEPEPEFLGFTREEVDFSQVKEKIL